MAVDEFVKQDYPLMCRGRDSEGQFALGLEDPVLVQITISKPPGSSSISSSVECKYNTGSHGQRCKASHPDVDKVGEGVVCPYAFDIPYALEKTR